MRKISYRSIVELEEILGRARPESETHRGSEREELSEIVQSKLQPSAGVPSRPPAA